MHILLATDGSKASEAAVDLLISLPWPKGILQVTVLHVLAPFWMDAPYEQSQIEELARIERVEAERVISDCVSRLKSEGYAASGEVIDGNPPEEIIARTLNLKADLIIIGSRGLDNVRSFILGSVSRKVVLGAPCSVLIARPLSHRPGKSRVTGFRVLMAVDGSDDSKAAVDFLTKLPLPKQTRIACIHVLDRKKRLIERIGKAKRAYRQFLAASRKREREMARNLIERAAELFRDHPVQVTTVIREGHPAEMIVGEARAFRADLIIVGCRGLTGIRRFLLGSISYDLVKHSPCSVLVVKHPVAM